jgi:hypothetical protein
MSLNLDKPRTLEGKKWAASQLLDEEAALTRQRHITVAPGQDTIYAIKLEQGKAFVQARGNNPNAPVPAYVRAEAEALETDDYVAVAQSIIDAAEAWHEVKGPEIEKTRRKWKIAISKATDFEGVRAAYDAGMVALRSL